MTDTLALDDALRYVADHRDETLADLVELAPKMIVSGFSLLGDNFHSPDEHFALGQLHGGVDMLVRLAYGLAERG